MKISSLHIVGVSYKNASAIERGKFSLDHTKSQELLLKAAELGIKSIVINSTCNRVELYAYVNSFTQIIDLLCDYSHGKKSNFNRHLLTGKHKKLENTIKSKKNEPQELEKEPTIKEEIIVKDFKCECGKIYKHYPSLWTHKKTCTFIEETQIVEKTEGSNDIKI